MRQDIYLDQVENLPVKVDRFDDGDKTWYLMTLGPWQTAARLFVSPEQANDIMRQLQIATRNVDEVEEVPTMGVRCHNGIDYYEYEGAVTELPFRTHRRCRHCRLPLAVQREEGVRGEVGWTHVTSEGNYRQVCIWDDMPLLRTYAAPFMELTAYEYMNLLSQKAAV